MDGKRTNGRPKVSWMDGVNVDLREKGTVRGGDTNPGCVEKHRPHIEIRSGKGWGGKGSGCVGCLLTCSYGDVSDGNTGRELGCSLPVDTELGEEVYRLTPTVFSVHGRLTRRVVSYKYGHASSQICHNVVEDLYFCQ